MKKKLLAIALIFAMVFSMAACGGSGNEGDSAEPAEKTELVVFDSEWYGVDSFQLDSSSGGQSWVGAPLFNWDPDNAQVVDNICQGWTVAEDGSNVTFTVPEGLYYSTGEEVQPEDVKASIEHGLEVSPYCDGYANIESIDIDGRTVKLNLTHFSSDMEYYFCADFICLIDKDELDSMSNDELMWGCHPYGPYRLADENGYVSGSEVNLVRNDNYKTFNPLVETNGPWAFEKIKCRFNVEEFTETEELKSGSADLIMSTSKDQRLELEGSEGVELINASYPCTNYVELNTDNSIFSDINVRKAFALAIDRDEFQEVSEGGLTPTYSMIIDTMQCFNADVKAWFQENYSYNPDKAIELLEESGWVDTDGDGIREKDGETLSFTFLAWTDWTVIPEAMANQLAQVGFDMSIEALDWNYIHERCNSDDYDMGIAGLAWAEPILIFNICYYDNNAPGNDETYRKMVKEIASEPDTEKRVEKIGEIQMRMFENMNIIPLFMDNEYTATRTELKGIVAKADGTLSTADMHWEA